MTFCILQTICISAASGVPRHLRQARAEGCLVQVPGAKKYTCQRSRSQIQRVRIHRDPGVGGEPKPHFLCQLLIKLLMHIRPLQISRTLILCLLQKRDGYRLGVNSTKLHQKNKHLHIFHILFVRFFFSKSKGIKKNVKPHS